MPGTKTDIQSKPMNHFLWGLLFGFIAPIIAIKIFQLVRQSTFSFFEFVIALVKMKILSNLISLAAIANLLVFYVFLRFNKLRSARGVIAMTMIWVVIMLLVKFIQTRN